MQHHEITRCYVCKKPMLPVTRYFGLLAPNRKACTGCPNTKKIPCPHPVTGAPAFPLLCCLALVAVGAVMLWYGVR